MATIFNELEGTERASVKKIFFFSGSVAETAKRVQRRLPHPYVPPKQNYPCKIVTMSSKTSFCSPIWATVTGIKTSPTLIIPTATQITSILERGP
jgi:hypothetical protein